MIPIPNPDCNQVALSMSTPDITGRCDMPEGHVPPCGSFNVMVHRHRKHVRTVSTPTPYRGRHARTVLR